MVQHCLIPDPPGSEIDGNGSRVTVSKGDVDKGERACGQKRSPVLADWRSVLIGEFSSLTMPSKVGDFRIRLGEKRGRPNLGAC